MAHIYEIIGHRIAEDRRMRAVPAAVVDDVVRLAVTEIANFLTNFKIPHPDMLDGDDFVVCEGAGDSGKGCGNFGTPESMHAEHDAEEGAMYFCGACHDENNGDTGPFGGGGTEDAG